MPLTEFTKFLLENKYFLDMQDCAQGVVHVTQNKRRITSFRVLPLTTTDRGGVQVSDDEVRIVCNRINVKSPV